MALNASNIPSTGGKRKKQPSLDAGAYPARLVQVIDMGVQPQRAWEGEEKPPKPEIYTTYEMLDEFVVDDDGNELEDKPRWLSETLAMNPLDSDLANSTKRYIALDPELEYGGDWSQLPGTPCTLTVSAKKDKKGKKDENGNVIVYNNITAVNTMRDKDAKKAEPLKNEPKVFDMDNPDMEVFLSLPDWIRDKIKSALNFEGGNLEAALEKIVEADEVKKRREKRREEAERAKSDSQGGDHREEEKAAQKAAPEPSNEDDDGDW